MRESEDLLVSLTAAVSVKFQESIMAAMDGKAKDRLTILHVGTLNKPIRPDQGYCPIETVIYNIDQGLVSRGQRSIVACSADSKIVGEKHVTVRRSLGDYCREDFQGRREMLKNHLRQTLKRAVRGDIDIVHMHEWVHHVYDGMFNPPVPIVVTLHVPARHSDLNEIYARWDRRQAEPSMYFVAISNYQKYEYAKLANIHRVIHHGIDVKTDLPPTTANAKGYLFAIGRITRVKGQDKAIELARTTGSKLIIAGCVQNKPEDKAFFESLRDSFDLTVAVGKYDVRKNYFRSVIKPLIECDKQIIFIGELNSAQKLQWYKHAKATLLPVQWGEPFGLVAVESMACGSPVLAMKKGALPEIILHRETGYVVDSVKDMITAVGRLDEIDRRTCRRHAQQNFSVARMAKNYHDFYRQVVEDYQFKTAVKKYRRSYDKSSPFATMALQ